jgi:AraC family transcriptional activator of tynA and feaB
MVQPNDDFLSAPKLDYDGFIAALRENFGCFSPARGTNIFAGRVRPRRVFGFAAVDLACNTVRVDRTELDIRRDDMEYYFVVAQLTGGSTIIQNDRVVNAAAGELVLLDSTRPVTLVGVRQAQWLGLQLPRQNLVSHLGFEPQGGTCGRGQGQAARILSQLALDPVGNVEPAVASADDYMRLVVYHLLGALFAPPAQSRAPTPRH